MEPKYKTIIDGKISDQREINSLVELCFKISKSHLKVILNKTNGISFYQGMHPDDIAVDSLASLFKKNDKGEFQFMMSAYNSWKPKIKTYEDELYFLNKIVIRRVEQHITLLLKEMNPFFAKIFDSINYFIKRNNYSKVTYLGTKYIVENDSIDLTGNLISYEEFVQLPNRFFAETQTMLPDIFAFIKERTTYFPAIPINALVMQIKNFYFENYAVEFDNWGEDTDDILSVEQMVSIGLKYAVSKLEKSYYEKEKLKKDEFYCFQGALRDIALDLIEGGINPGLHHYLRYHMKELSMDDYWKKYHNIIEYLFKIMRSKIAENIQLAS